MCGIYGMLSAGHAAADAELVARMSGTLVHRGPDGDGTFVRGPVALGCRRLAIIDLDHGGQPLFDETRDVAVVCNGEIYNHRRLRDELARRGHRFRTGSDAEVIPHLYEERGPEFVDALDGMFGIALWDARTRRLLLVRDRLGEKPLYYAITPAGLFFASEPKAILASQAVTATPDVAAIAGYLRTGFVAAPRSAFAEVTKLPPGTMLVVEPGRTEHRVYWDVLDWLARPALDVDFETAARAVRQELDGAVAAALESDVPVGVFLSGGLDSTSVAASVRAQRGTDFDTFTLGFDVPSFDERGPAGHAAAALGTRHHTLRITPELFLEGVQALAPLLDEPMADQSLVPEYLLSRVARSVVKVILVGEGSDELFAGYPTYPGGLLAARYGRLPAVLRRLLHDAAPYLGAPRGNTTIRYLLRRFLELAEAPAATRHRTWMGCMDVADIDALLAPGSPLAAPGPVALPEVRGELEALLALDLTGYLPDDLLFNIDRATMAASLEGRAPFLNHHLVELVCRLPAPMKLRGVVGKRVLRRAVADRIPPSTRRRIKRGLSVPLSAWLAGPLLPFARETLGRLDPHVFRRSTVERLLREHVDGRRDHRRALWALIVLQLWADAQAVRWDVVTDAAPAGRLAATAWEAHPRIAAPTHP